MTDSTPLRLFVAMPGTDMGSNASYSNPEAVKNNLLVPVVEKLETRLGKKVTLSIEKDKRESGVIHESMFAEARDADVYLADLTGANPNVYLELGVRWALKDRITVLLCQNVEDLKFNVFANRAILYYPDIIIKAIDDVVDSILAGLNNSKPDNPVRLNSNIVPIKRSEIEEFKSEIERLKKERGEDLLLAASATDQLSDKVSILRQAVEANPASTQAILELGIVLRSLRQYDDAIDVLKKGVRLAPEDSLMHRELGVTYSKFGIPLIAVDSLREAVRLAPKDSEAWSNLGGALRRLGMEKAPENFDKETLVEARNCYSNAHSLNPFDLYSGLNVPRLDLLLSKWDPSLASSAKIGFTKQIYLSRHMAQEKPGDVWRKFDLADTLLFSGHYVEASSAFDDAVNSVPDEGKADTISSVTGPLKHYQLAGVLEPPLLEEVLKVIDKLKSKIPKIN